MGDRLVLLGGGHAHVELVRQLGDLAPGLSVTVVSPEENHYYSGMGPGMVGLRYRPEELCFPLRSLCGHAGVRFVKGEAERIDCTRRRVLLISGESLTYDALSCNVGSVVSCGGLKCGPSVVPVKPIRNLLVAGVRIERLLLVQPVALTVVGGGPAAFEIAGNLSRRLRLLSRHITEPTSTHAERSSVTIIPGRSPLRQFSRRARRLVERELRRGGVRMGPRSYAVAASSSGVECEDGSSVESDVTFLATGVRAPELFAKSGLPIGRAGELLVDERLAAVRCDGVFGAGDCVQLQEGRLEKVGVYAVRETPILLQNLLGYLNRGSPSTFAGTGRYMLLFNLGTDRGVFVRGRVSAAGRAAMALKDRIDRTFAGRFRL